MIKSLLLITILACSAWGQYTVVTNSSPIFVLDYNTRQNVILLPTTNTTIVITNTPQKSAGGYAFNNPLPYEPNKTTVHPWGVNIIISQPTNACFSVTLGNSSSYGSTLVLAGRTNSGAILRMVGNNSTATDIHIVEWVTNVHPAYAFGVEGGGGGGGGSCTTEAQAEGDVAHFDDAIDWTGGQTWNAISFVAGSSFTACKAQAYLAKQGTPGAGTLQVLIYSDSAGAPGSLVGTGSATVDRTTIGGSLSFVEFTGLSAALTSGTTYWFILKASAQDTDGSNRILAQKDNTGETAAWFRSGDGTTWGTAAGINTTVVFKLFSN